MQDSTTQQQLIEQKQRNEILTMQMDLDFSKHNKPNEQKPSKEKKKKKSTNKCKQTKKDSSKSIQNDKLNWQSKTQNTYMEEINK